MQALHAPVPSRNGEILRFLITSRHRGSAATILYYHLHIQPTPAPSWRENNSQLRPRPSPSTLPTLWLQVTLTFLCRTRTGVSHSSWCVCYRSPTTARTTASFNHVKIAFTKKIDRCAVCFFSINIYVSFLKIAALQYIHSTKNVFSFNPSKYLFHF